MMTGFRPAAAGKRMMAGDDPLDDLEEEEIEEGRILLYLRKIIREHINGFYIFGLKKSSPKEIKNTSPNFYNFLKTNYSDLLTGCTFAVKTKDKISTPEVYALLPDVKMTVISWDHSGNKPIYKQGEDIARALERYKNS